MSINQAAEGENEGDEPPSDPLSLLYASEDAKLMDAYAEPETDNSTQAVDDAVVPEESETLDEAVEEAIDEPLEESFEESVEEALDFEETEFREQYDNFSTMYSSYSNHARDEEAQEISEGAYHNEDLSHHETIVSSREHMSFSEQKEDNNGLLTGQKRPWYKNRVFNSIKEQWYKKMCADTYQAAAGDF